MKVYILNDNVYDNIHEVKATKDYIEAMKNQNFNYILNFVNYIFTIL